jgi:DNA-binding FadR family transcriptional regulator
MKKISRQSLHVQIVNEVGRRIVSGEFRPGQALPSEIELCGSLGISRTALREALRVLSAKGLLEARPKIGTLVKATAAWNFLDADILAWRLESDHFERVLAELYQLRQLIEPIAASLAAAEASDHDIEQLQASYLDMEAMMEEGDRIVEPDVRFHCAIIAASGNLLFASIGNMLADALAINFRIGLRNPRGQVHSLPLHKNVLDAIVARDPVTARIAMQKLIEDSHDDVRLIGNSAKATHCGER